MPRTSAAGESFEPAAVCEILESLWRLELLPTCSPSVSPVFLLFIFAEFVFSSDLEYSPSIFAEEEIVYHDGFLTVQIRWLPL
jgi:hypothetical protein